MMAPMIVNDSYGLFYERRYAGTESKFGFSATLRPTIILIFEKISYSRFF